MYICRWLVLNKLLVSLLEEKPLGSNSLPRYMYTFLVYYIYLLCLSFLSWSCNKVVIIVVWHVRLLASLLQQLEVSRSLTDTDLELLPFGLLLFTFCFDFYVLLVVMLNGIIVQWNPQVSEEYWTFNQETAFPEACSWDCSGL